MRAVADVTNEGFERHPPPWQTPSVPDLEQPVRRNDPLLHRHGKQRCRLPIGVAAHCSSHQRVRRLAARRVSRPRRQARFEVALDEHPHPLHGSIAAVVRNNHIDRATLPSGQPGELQRRDAVEPAVLARLEQPSPQPSGLGEVADLHRRGALEPPASGRDLAADVVAMQPHCGQLSATDHTALACSHGAHCNLTLPRPRPALVCHAAHRDAALRTARRADRELWKTSAAVGAPAGVGWTSGTSCSRTGNQLPYAHQLLSRPPPSAARSPRSDRRCARASSGRRRCTTARRRHTCR